MKKISLDSPLQKKILLVFLILFQIAIVASMFVRASLIKREAVKNGTIVRLSCTAYDPFDPFKGRYVKLSVSEEDLKSEGEKLGLDLSKLSKTCSDYYMQEDYADFVDKMHWKDFNDLKPILELYVDKKGSAIQKSLLVHENEEEIPIEKYISERLE